MDIDFLDFCLNGYPAPGLTNFLYQGFTLGFPQETFECRNLLSAMLDPGSVDLLLQTEVEKGFLIGPFVTPPFDSWCVNQIDVALGKFSNKKHFIYDLSAPHSLSTPSLNSLVPPEEFSLKLHRSMPPFSRLSV